MKGNIKEILQLLFKDLESENEVNVINANEMIDSILSETFNISPLSLFLYSIRKKDCVTNLHKLITGENITDFEIARALSSLITHLIIATEKDPRKFKDLRIHEVLLLLDDFITGKIDRPEIIKFFENIL